LFIKHKLKQIKRLNESGKFNLTVICNFSINKIKQYMFHTHHLTNMPTKEKNIKIDEDIHQVLLILAVWFIVRILVNNILLITWIVARVTRRISHIDLKMLTLPKYLSWHSVFSGVRVAGSLVLLCSVMFIPLSFFFWPLLLNVFCRLAFDYLLVSSNYSYPQSCYYYLV
jgi:hypothetical protein